MLNLQRCRAHACIAQQVKEQLRTEVANPDTAGKLLVDERLHRRPSLLDSGIAELDLAVLGVPAWRVPDRGVDVFQRDGEVHNVKIEVVDTPVSELLAADRLDAVTVVEAVPELRDNEELLALYEAFFYGACNALPGFDFVAVVWWRWS